jgi:hypothetical protein
LTSKDNQDAGIGSRRCRGCGRELEAPSDVGWECECGVAVCVDPDCFEEFFKRVASGEATRCRSCGLVM